MAGLVVRYEVVKVSWLLSGEDLLSWCRIMQKFSHLLTVAMLSVCNDLMVSVLSQLELTASSIVSLFLSLRRR